MPTANFSIFKLCLVSNMDSHPEIVVFDTPSRDGKTWSHHVLRILYSIRLKGLSYSIKCIEYPDIVSTFEPTTLQPKDDPVEPYEIPVVMIQTASGDATYYMTPEQITETLEMLVPEPSLYLESPRSVEFRTRMSPALAPIMQIAVGHVRSILSDRGAKSFAEKRRERWGKSIDQWIAEHPKNELMAVAEPRLKALGDWLMGGPGPFAEGDKPGYADFTFVSIIKYAKAVGVEDVFEAAIASHPAIKKLYGAFLATGLGDG